MYMRLHLAPLPFGLLQPLPVTSLPQNFFSKLLIKQGQSVDHITDESETLGLYVDVNDGWKVKATSDTSLWDKFKFVGFVTAP